MIIETQTPSIYIKDQSLSAEVQEWLKTHKATVLPSFKSTQTGYTRDYTPNANKTKKEPKPKTQEQISAQERKEIKAKEKAIDLAWRRVEQKRLFAIFSENAKLGDLIRLAKIIGCSGELLSSAKNSGHTLKRDRLEKIAKALETFEYGLKERKETYCEKHDSYDFIKKGDYSRCRECVNDYRKTAFANSKNKDQKAEAERIEKNRKAYKFALENNLKTFSAICKKHGYTAFGVQGESYRCKQCRKDANNKRNLEKKANLN